MNNKITFGVFGLAVGFLAGYVFFAAYLPKGEMHDMSMMMGESNKMEMDDHSMSDMVNKDNMMGMQNEVKMPQSTQLMHHSVIETNKPVSISFSAIKDTKDGYNLHVMTNNYKWTPETVNTKPIQGEGHAHVYVNDVKVARLYGDWFHVPGTFFKTGENEIKVTLNANDHSEWGKNGKVIESVVTVTK